MTVPDSWTTYEQLRLRDPASLTGGERFYDLEAIVALDTAMSRLAARAAPIAIPARQNKIRWRR